MPTTNYDYLIEDFKNEGVYDDMFEGPVEIDPVLYNRTAAGIQWLLRDANHRRRLPGHTWKTKIKGEYLLIWII